jgi:hypothetical protein
MFGLPGDLTMRKLLLAVVSLTSSGAFAYSALSDRRTVRSLRDALPEGGIRRASLEPRTASPGHSMAWEIPPFVILMATIIVMIGIGRRLGHVTTEMWAMQLLQTAFVVGALAYSVRRGIAVPNVSSRLAMLRDRPELALEFGQRLAARENRYFAIAKTGVTLLLGLSATKHGLELLNPSVSSAIGTANWVLVGVLLLLYAAFFYQVVAMTRRMQHQAGPHEPEVNHRG